MLPSSKQQPRNFTSGYTHTIALVMTSRVFIRPGFWCERGALRCAIAACFSDLDDRFPALGVRCSGEARPRHGARSFNELSGTFERDVDAETAPRQLCRITFAADCNPAAPDIDPILAGGELAREMPMDAIACEETCTGANETKIIDGDELDFIAPCPMLEAQDQVSDAAKAINGNSSRHATLNCYLLATLHALNFNALIQVNSSHTAQLPRQAFQRASSARYYV